MGILNKVLGLAVQATHIRPAIGRMPTRLYSCQLSNGTPVKLLCNETAAIKAVKENFAQKHIPFTDIDAGETIHHWTKIKKTKANVTEKELLDTMHRIRIEAFPPLESRMQAQLRYAF